MRTAGQCILDLADDTLRSSLHIFPSEMEHVPSQARQKISAAEITSPPGRIGVPSIAVRFDREPFLRKRDIDPRHDSAIDTDLMLSLEVGKMRFPQEASEPALENALRWDRLPPLEQFS